SSDCLVSAGGHRLLRGHERRGNARYRSLRARADPGQGRRRMNREEHGRVTAGIALFIVLTFLGSWCMVAVLRLSGATVAPAPLGTRLFTTSLLYALTMGWQPIVATWFVRQWVEPPDGLDLGLRS